MSAISEIMEKMPEQFDAEKAGDMEAVIQLDLDGEDGGQWNVVIGAGAIQVNDGLAAEADATLHMNAADFVDMSTGDLNPIAAFMSGKVKVDGDLNTIMKFQSVVGL